MPAPVRQLTIDFLTWVSAALRTYGDAMDAWRTSCPRLSVWEDAIIDGLIQVQDGGAMAQAKVALTPRGRAMLNGKSE
jgi:hypothetical protein